MLQNSHVWAWLDYNLFINHEEDPFSDETFKFYDLCRKEPRIEANIFSFEEMGGERVIQ